MSSQLGHTHFKAYTRPQRGLCKYHKKSLLLECLRILIRVFLHINAVIDNAFQFLVGNVLKSKKMTHHSITRILIYGQFYKFLEMSNVSVVEEMVDMIIGQRAYEVNSKAVQTSDELLHMANNLKR